jgi:hypothetical protein
MDPLNATIEEFAAEGYTHVSCHCPRYRVTRTRPMSWLPKNLDGAHAQCTSSPASVRLSPFQCQPAAEVLSIRPCTHKTRSHRRMQASLTKAR